MICLVLRSRQLILTMTSPEVIAQKIQNLVGGSTIVQVSTWMLSGTQRLVAEYFGTIQKINPSGIIWSLQRYLSVPIEVKNIPVFKNPTNKSDKYIVISMYFHIFGESFWKGEQGRCAWLPGPDRKFGPVRINMFMFPKRYISKTEKPKLTG